MAIESSDYELIKHLRNENPTGKKLAILGDCHVHAGIENLSNEMKFETIDTFDVMGNPTHKLDLNEPLDEKFMSDISVSMILISSGNSSSTFSTVYPV